MDSADAQSSKKTHATVLKARDAENGLRFRKRVRLAMVIFLGFALAVWSIAIPPDDCHSLNYGLWRIGLKSIKPEHLHGCLLGDGTRSWLVEGRSAGRLRRRFGRMRSRHDSTPEQQYYNDHDLAELSVLWIGDLPWVVILGDDGLGTELRLMKG